MATLFFKRAKIFMRNVDGKSERYVGYVNSGGSVTQAPDWVRETETFKNGVADKSIVDLTPPAANPRSRKAVEKREALGHDPLKDVDTPQAQNEVPDVPAAEGDEEGPGSVSEETTAAPAKPFGNQMPQKTPKGFTTQPTASGRRAK